MPLASIVIPTFNQRPEYLQQALDSALSQTAGVEVIVVDDGSEKPIESEHPQVTVLRHARNLGISAALNTGIRAAAADWICWLPSDDLFAPRKVELQHGAVTASGAKCSFHQYYTFATTPEQPAGQSLRWDWSSHRRQRKQLSVGCAINGLTVMVHRSVFDVVGLFDESYRYGQDWEMWARISQAYEWHAMEDVLAYRRADGTNLTAAIERDEARRLVRDAEDARIKAKYA